MSSEMLSEADRAFDEWWHSVKPRGSSVHGLMQVAFEAGWAARSASEQITETAPALDG
jgi:hypothetical protein